MHGLPLILTLDLPAATPSNNSVKNMHFRAYKALREQFQTLVLSELPVDRPARVDTAFIEIDRHSAGGGLDWDNAYGGLKPLLDCLVQGSDRNPDGLGLIRDDNPAAMPLPPAMRQFPAKRGAGRTVVRIYDAAGLAQPC